MRNTFALSKRSSVIAVIVLLSGAWLAAALHICPKCGYENDPGITLCAHCRAVLKKSEQGESNTSSEQNDHGTPGRSGVNAEYPMPASEVTAEIERASSALNADKPALSRLFALNVLAMVQLVNPADRLPSWGEPLVKNIALLEKKILEERAVCPLCGGKGRSLTVQAGFTGERPALNTGGSLCRRCGGTGRTDRLVSFDTVRILLGQTRKEYDRLQRALGRKEEGRGWIPAKVSEQLNLEQRVKIRRILAPVCKECFGFGRVSCKNCKGTSVVPCPERCDKGWVPAPRNDSDKKMLGGGSDRRLLCKVCGGKGDIPCPSCDGTGRVACGECNGTGQCQLCSKCGGKGIIECRKCRGSGEYKGTKCRECDGEGKVICSGCYGCGRRVK